MQYVHLGRTGLRVSRICLGMMSFGLDRARPWQLDEEAAVPIVRRAVEAGVTFFDTADVYALGTGERVTGRLLAKFFPRRDDYVLATKVYFPMGSGPNDGGLSRKHILSAIDASLERLGTDHVDLYQIHRWDGTTPVEETMAALDCVVQAGKARYIGASAMFAWQFAKAQYTARLHGWTQFVSMQNHYNLVYREEEREMIPYCVATGVGLIPWSPLARGLLAGNRGRGGQKRTVRANNDQFGDTLYTDDDFAVVEAANDVAADNGVKPAQVALAWMLAKPGITAPIVGATKLAHLEDALGAVDVTLSDKDVERIESSYQPHTIRGHQ